MVNSTIHVHYGKFFALSALFTVSTSIAQVRGVVMMAPQSTKNIICFSSDERLDFDDRLIPQPYNISSPIVAVPKYKMYIGDYTETWTHAWQYQSENVSVFAYQAHRETMEDRFVIDENIGDTGVSLYAVFDGFQGNFTVDYLAYGFMDKLRNKIINIKKGKRDKTTSPYIYPNGSINYNKLLHDEVLAADKHISLTCKSNRSIEDYSYTSEPPPDHCYSGSTAIVAVIDSDYLFVANVGDSYAVMCGAGGNVTSLVKAHDLEKNSKEIARCEEATKGRRHPTFTGISRCIGESVTKGTVPYIISDPEVFTYNLYQCKCKFIVLASDGIYRPFITSWDNMDKADQPIVTYLNQHIETKLLEAMMNMTLHMYPYSRSMEDNKIIMVVKTSIRNK